MKTSSSLLLLVFAVAILLSCNAHIEDICVSPPGKCLKCGIYNFYTLAAKLGCKYGKVTNACTQAVFASQSSSGFAEYSNCRGIIHFNAIYFLAVALGFKQDIAYQMSSFSQAIDFSQYKGVDSCGEAMDKKYWTPPLRGMVRTETKYGGTNRHLGIPFVGIYDYVNVTTVNGSLVGPPLRQHEKKYTGGTWKYGCLSFNFKLENSEIYAKECPGLIPDNQDNFYDGALSQGRRWAFGETNLLCNGGFTVEDPATGSLFTGSSCPTRGQQFKVDIGAAVQGPIPLTGGALQFGDQVMNFECSPNCTATNYTVIPESIVYARDFGKYLEEQATKNGYAIMNDPPGPVPELIARFGFYLHWVSDRNSHWYCCDASGSGIKVVKVTDAKGTYYNAYQYLETNACNIVDHNYVHYWEQGVRKLAPGSYYALVNYFREITAFRQANLLKHPEWFRVTAETLSFEQLVGTDEEPGILYKITNIKDAQSRFLTEVAELKKYKLPPMPGFEKACKSRGLRA